MGYVRDLLVAKGSQVWTVSSDESIKNALRLMKRKNIGALVVVDSTGSPKGIISERDIIRAAASGMNRLEGKKVRNCMSSSVYTVNQQDSTDRCMMLMSQKRIRHLPIVEGGKMVGIISIGDIVKHTLEEKNILIDQLEHYISGSL